MKTDGTLQVVLTTIVCSLKPVCVRLIMQDVLGASSEANGGISRPTQGEVKGGKDGHKPQQLGDVRQRLLLCPPGLVGSSCLICVSPGTQRVAFSVAACCRRGACCPPGALGAAFRGKHLT